jgi:hypothetical protein
MAWGGYSGTAIRGILAMPEFSPFPKKCQNEFRDISPELLGAQERIPSPLGLASIVVSGLLPDVDLVIRYLGPGVPYFPHPLSNREGVLQRSAYRLRLSSPILLTLPLWERLSFHPSHAADSSLSWPSQSPAGPGRGPHRSELL